MTEKGLKFNGLGERGAKACSRFGGVPRLRWSHRRQRRGSNGRVCSGREGRIQLETDYKFIPNYKETLAEFYNVRSPTYGAEWHYQMAKFLIDDCGIQQGESVLDMCAGTAISSIFAGDLVGPTGRVVGVDIAGKMLARARETLAAKGYTNVELVEEDVEVVDFPNGEFDHITCASAFVWLTDPRATLVRWKRFLKPGGGVAFDAPTVDTFVTYSTFFKAVENAGYVIQGEQMTGSVAGIRDLFVKAGFVDVRLEEREGGEMLDLDLTIAAFEDILISESFPPALPLMDVSADGVQAIRDEYVKILRGSATDGKVFDNRTMLFAYARKPE